ncbi:MAG: ATP phosphoribosyltransferase regulatory subunit [Oscillospiraceae bacterium]|nr:ATP phosphoribosyltransferase regulatory subunit [Oscillospiraceae bacterium]
MRRYDLITPEGTRDYLFEECYVKRAAEAEIHAIFKRMGYAELITPGLEFYDVFDLNSRYFPQEELYKLTDSKGRLLVLRPDSTMPIARVVATRLKDAMLPLRLFYNQPVYRFEPSLKGRSDEIVQTGIELIGSASRMADVEIISAAVSVLSSVGVNYSLELGDVGIFRELMHSLNATPAQKEEIRSLIEEKNYPALNDLLDHMGDNRITKALKKLPTLFGGEEVFDKAAALFQDARIEMLLQQLKELYLEICELNQNGKITVDLGLVNKTDYYTGLVIKGYLEGCGEEVLSGGRYDKLLSEFGYDIPAVGMAVNVDAVASAAAKLCKPQLTTPDVLVAAADGYEAQAVAVAEKFRREGRIVEHALFSDMELVHEYARDKNIGKIIIVSEEITEVDGNE